MNEDFITTFPSFAITFHFSVFKAATDFRLCVKFKSLRSQARGRISKSGKLAENVSSEGCRGSRENEFLLFLLIQSVLDHFGGRGRWDYSAKWGVVY